MRLLDNGAQVAAVTGDRESHDREHELPAAAAVLSHGSRGLGRDREMALGLVRRSPIQLIRGVSALSSAFPATLPAGKPASSSWAVAALPPRTRPNQLSESRRPARLHCPAAC